VCKTRVLFLCVGNTARSQMAEAFLRAYGGDRFEARSAGFQPREIEPLAFAVMKELGFDMRTHFPKGLKELPRNLRFDYVITVCNRAERRCSRLPSLGEHLSWPFEDPAACVGSEEDRLASFRKVRDGIELFIREWLQERDTDCRQPHRNLAATTRPAHHGARRQRRPSRGS